VVTARPLRVIFFGTPAFAVPTLERLLRSAHTVVGVVTQPDRPRGRGHQVVDSPVKQVALAAGLPVLQPARLKDESFLRNAAALDADLGIVAAYGRILTDAVLAMPRLGLLNVHASLLPRYRGAAPVHRAVIAGETQTGVTIMRIVKALDAGPMLGSVVRPIDSDETSADVERDLAQLGADLLLTTLDAVIAGTAHEQPQTDADATYAPRLTKADAAVYWASPANAVHNLIRGLHPWPHASTYWDAERVILHRSEHPGHEDDSTPDAPPGTIVAAEADRLTVATGTVPLRLLQLQLEGKRPMSVREFLAGHSLRAGDRFLQSPAT
jgi:methionyl-tRNA formyltransferase